MRVKITDIQNPEDLKHKLCSAVDQIVSLGIPGFSRASLSLGLRRENGNPLRIQNEEGEELVLLIGYSGIAHLAVDRNELMEDVNKSLKKKKNKT